MRQENKNLRNQGSNDKKIDFLVQSRLGTFNLILLFSSLGLLYCLHLIDLCYYHSLAVQYSVHLFNLCLPITYCTVQSTPLRTFIYHSIAVIHNTMHITSTSVYCIGYCAIYCTSLQPLFTIPNTFHLLSLPFFNFYQSF
jgi:hypothetical protein